MSSQNQKDGRKVRPPIGTLFIMFVLNVIAALGRLFHVKNGSWGNMSSEETEAFSPVMDDMKQKLAKKDR